MSGYDPFLTLTIGAVVALGLGCIFAAMLFDRR
jgi:hypothetical protein